MNTLGLEEALSSLVSCDPFSRAWKYYNRSLGLTLRRHLRPPRSLSIS